MDNTSNIIHNTLGQPKLSIIVPIYNVEQYLRKCVDSLLVQDYSDYEIILVDDGSTDNCPAICDEYASPSFVHSLTRSVVIKVIHQKNGGLSAARNSGIKIANGEYICFVDSDDYWQPNVLAGLMEQIERDNLDVLRFRLQYVNPQYEVYNPYKSDPFRGNDYSETPTDGVSFLNSRMNTACYAWQFILRRDLIIGNQTSDIIHNTLLEEHHTSYIIHNTFEKDICLFTEGIFFEDTDWTPRMLCKAKRVASTNTVVYNYLVREGSITNAVNRSKQKKVLDDKMRLISTMQQQAIELHKSGRYNVWFSRMIADTVISIIGILSTTFYEEKDAYLEQLHDMKVFPIAKKSIKARLINLSPHFVVYLLHLKNV